MRTTETDVLVVGAGPAGLTAGALLARSGVDAITVTKYPSTANSPRAHITNQRTIEVFRDLGIEEQVRAIATPNELMGNNVWAASFAGQEIARLMTWGSGPGRKADYESASPSAVMNAPQHVLEPVILNAARSHGADIRFSTELMSITQDRARSTPSSVNAIPARSTRSPPAMQSGLTEVGAPSLPRSAFPCTGRWGSVRRSMYGSRPT